MNRPIFACDRCGHWYTKAPEFAHQELPYEQDAIRLASSDTDLCAGCADDWRKKALSPAPSYEVWFKKWMADGKGVHVKPKHLR